MKVNIANVLVDNITKEEAILRVDEFVKSGSPHQIVTVYSEFVVFAQNDPKYLQVLNQADLSLPDGIGVLWAAKFLSLQASNWLQAFTQYIYSGAALVFNPAYARTVLREKVSGSSLIYDVAKLAAKEDYSLALVGGIDGVAVKAAETLQKKFPGLKINLAVSDRAFDAKIVQEIAASNSDILCIAYQPPKQELWLADNLSKLNVKAVIGLGGTFDYLAGKRSPAPSWLVNLGLEWFYRLITQPWRIKRIWNALVVFSTIIFRFKLKQVHVQS